jgi:nitrate/nitrite-specific signal transduction histidine kinase
MRRSILRSNAPGSSFSARSPSRRACSSPGAWWVPIQTLPAGAAHLGSGDLGRRIAIKTGDEVEALAAQFNDMAGRLQESYANLEKKVELRTQELSESLQQQTATSDVLRVISSSPSELDPIFQTILANGARLCEANFGILALYDDRKFRVTAMNNVPPRVCQVPAERTGD